MTTEIEIKDLQDIPSGQLGSADIPVAVDTTPYKMTVDQIYTEILAKLEAAGLKIGTNEIGLYNSDVSEFMTITAEGADGSEKLNLENEGV